MVKENSSIDKTVILNAEEFLNSSSKTEINGKKHFKNELIFSSDEMRAIWFAPGGTLSRESFKLKKLMAYGFFVQKEPALIIDIGNNRRCDVCGKTVMETASVKWNDRKRDGSYKEFRINAVCERCLDKTGVRNIRDVLLVSYMLEKPENTRYRHLHDAVDYNCILCYSRDGDSTFVNVPVKDMLIQAPVCDKHLEFLCGVKSYEKTSVDGYVDSGIISADLANRIKLFNLQQKGDLIE